MSSDLFWGRHIFFLNFAFYVEVQYMYGTVHKTEMNSLENSSWSKHPDPVLSPGLWLNIASWSQVLPLWVGRLCCSCSPAFAPLFFPGTCSALLQSPLPSLSPTHRPPQGPKGQAFLGHCLFLGLSAELGTKQVLDKYLNKWLRSGRKEWKKKEMRENFSGSYYQQRQMQYIDHIMVSDNNEEAQVIVAVWRTIRPLCWGVFIRLFAYVLTHRQSVVPKEKYTLPTEHVLVHGQCSTQLGVLKLGHGQHWGGGERGWS